MKNIKNQTGHRTKGEIKNRSAAESAGYRLDFPDEPKSIASDEWEHALWRYIRSFVTKYRMPIDRADSGMLERYVKTRHIYDQVMRARDELSKLPPLEAIRAAAVDKLDSKIAQYSRMLSQMEQSLGLIPLQRLKAQIAARSVGGDAEKNKAESEDLKRMFG